MASKIEVEEDNEARLSEIIEVIQSIARGNFTVKASVTSRMDVIDALATGLNMLTEELEEDTIGLRYVEKRINSILEVVQKCANGDYEFCEISEKRDNFDALSMGLNMMIDDIMTSYQEARKTQEATLNILEDLEKRGKELSIINEKLQREIAERNAVEKVLQRTLENLEAKNKELDDYVYMTSHDLKAPLVTIQGFADLLKRKHGPDLNEEARHYIDTIINGAQSLNVLVTELLALSRAGRRKIKVGKIAVSEVVQSTINALKTMADEKCANVSFPKNLPEVTYDLTNLKEIFSNLLANAINYSKVAEKPNIEIGWKENGNENMFWVKDNGIGIEKKHWEKIFQPFERVARDKKGTGIGLSIVKKIVERHGGRIWIDSIFGEGTTFYFTIPKEMKICLMQD